MIRPYASQPKDQDENGSLAGAGGDGQDVPLIAYRYDRAGNLAEVINSSGRPVRLSYDDEGRLTGWEDRNGFAYCYYYDDHGRCVRGEGPSGALSGAFAYDPANLVTTHTNAAGAVTVYEVSPSCKVAAVTDPLGSIARSEHDQYGRVVRRTDPLDRVTRWSYDQNGNLIAITRPDGSQAIASYNGQNLPVLITEPDGATWRQEYDQAGNLLWRQAPDGAVTRYTYDDRSHLASATDPLGVTTRVQCNSAGLPVEITGPDGAATRYERDTFGRVTAITAPDGAITRLAWTLEGQLSARVLPDGTAERFTYDGEGNLTQHLDSAARLTRCEYGAFGQLVAQTAPDGARIEFAYDHGLRLASVRNGSLTWLYEYDAAGRRAAETDYNGAVTCYVHDVAGQLTAKVNAAGQHLKYAYDLLGNLTERKADDVVTRFGYDPAGRLILATNPDTVLEIVRDEMGRVTAEVCNGRAVRSGYDAVGRRVHRITPSGVQTRWTYDIAGRPTLLEAAGQELRFGYDQAGRETLREMPGGVRLSQEWDAVGRLAAQVLTGRAQPDIPEPPADVPQPRPAIPHPSTATGMRVLQRRGYQYRADGCLANTEDSLSGPRHFGLDPAGRVTGVTGPDWTERYAYDVAGNITAASWPTPPLSLITPLSGPDAQGLRQYAGTLIRDAGQIRYQHDHSGRIIVRQRVRDSRGPDTWRYEWSADDRMTAAVTPDGTRWCYIYDALGRRVAKQRLATDGQVAEDTHFTWDGPTLAEQTVTVLHDGEQGRDSARSGLASQAADQVITWDYQPGTFTPVTQAERYHPAPQDQVDEQFYAIVTDLVGTPVELVSTGGDLAGYEQHTLWGTTLWHPDGATTPLRFPGQYADSETGLHYNYERYYDPATGSYLSPDPLGLAPAPNPHTYVPNPAMLTDPLGLDCPPAGGTGGSATPPGPRFIAKPNGDIVEVPHGATGPTPVRSGKGFQFTGGSGGYTLDPRVSGVRVMDPVTTGKYPLPNGYVSYFNQAGQAVNPFTGQTLARSDPLWHWQWNP